MIPDSLINELMSPRNYGLIEGMGMGDTDIDPDGGDIDGQYYDDCVLWAEYVPALRDGEAPRESNRMDK
jgi:hypothetical protein